MVASWTNSRTMNAATRRMSQAGGSWLTRSHRQARRMTARATIRRAMASRLSQLANFSARFCRSSWRVWYVASGCAAAFPSGGHAESSRQDRELAAFRQALPLGVADGPLQRPGRLLVLLGPVGRSRPSHATDRLLG